MDQPPTAGSLQDRASKDEVEEIQMPATTPSTRNAVPANAERNASSFIRPWKVQAVRAAIAADTYLTEERLRGAVERLLPVLFEDEFIGV